MSSPFPPEPPGGRPPGLTPGGGGALPPSAGWIPVGAGAPPVVPVVAGGARRRGRPAWTALGIVLIVAGIGAAIALFVAGTQRYSDGIEKLARGPANCVTTLDVVEDATYYFYVETKGEVGDVRGNCPTTGADFDVEGDGDATMSLSDEDGEAVRLRRADGVSYDSGGYSGTLERTARLDAGRYQLAVESDDDIAVAVGRDVEGLKTNLLLPLLVGIGGLVLGVVALLLGRRGAAAPPAAGSALGVTPFTPAGGTGLAAPGQPVPAQPPAPGGSPFPGQVPQQPGAPGGWGVPGQPPPPPR